MNKLGVKRKGIKCQGLLTPKWISHKISLCNYIVKSSVTQTQVQVYVHTLWMDIEFNVLIGKCEKSLLNSHSLYYCSV